MTGARGQGTAGAGSGWSRQQGGVQLAVQGQCVSLSPTVEGGGPQHLCWGGCSLQPLRYLALREQGAGFGWGVQFQVIPRVHGASLMWKEVVAWETWHLAL